ncbi:COG1 [Bugula neritina]|uniref:Conserved oligomeric Golgi complex subunit 1 n=1 Tax=Bugula neritina TaxID=10212 RepID=A0A7J7KD81_BUGNE|nr:COG1 [Bugula neritina]
MQTTWCLQNCFNLLCNGVNKTELVSSVLLQILSVYKSNLQDTSGHVTQAVALQYLFDVWYLSSTLLWRESDKAAEIESLCSSLTKDLQARVDPFDLDVFTPYMQRHCSRQRSRSAVLFGAIADSEKLLSTATRQPQTGRAEQHNVLPLYTTVAARFPLLPVISETSRVSAQTAASKRPPAASAVAASLTSSKADSSGITKAQSEPFMKMSSSFYDRIGSGAMSWFTRGSNANN